MMATHIWQQIEHLPIKPIATIGLLAVNVYCHLFDVRILGVHLHDTRFTAFRPDALLEWGEWQRVFLSPLIHLDDAHLYYNMMSLSWKGTLNIHLQCTHNIN